MSEEGPGSWDAWRRPGKRSARYGSRQGPESVDDVWLQRRLPVFEVVGAPDVRRQLLQSERDATTARWWEAIPAVRQLLLDGLELGPVTVLIGENGSGKSTIVEAIAMAHGLAAEGGSTGSRHRSRPSESGLNEQVELRRNALGGRGGYFIRAESMHGFFTYLELNPGRSPEPRFHEMSHGESFVALVESRFSAKHPGLYVPDEPESALSFDNQLRLVQFLRELVSSGRHQVVMATHSPILAALPEATLLELDGTGFHEGDHDNAALVRKRRASLNHPSDFLP